MLLGDCVMLRYELQLASRPPVLFGGHTSARATRMLANTEVKSMDVIRWRQLRRPLYFRTRGPRDDPTNFAPLLEKLVVHRQLDNGEVFDEEFSSMVRALITAHHRIYPALPPQGIFFEALISQAYHELGWQPELVTASAPNNPGHDLLVLDQRISVKTETGRNTRSDLIHLTKLCTTEREPWEPRTLVDRVLSHLSRYDRLLMLRAIWPGDQIRYQLLEIPIPLLRTMDSANIQPVGRRPRRQSLGGDVQDAAGIAFHVHFDGSDGKCQIRNLPVARCRMLSEWAQVITHT